VSEAGDERAADAGPAPQSAASAMATAAFATIASTFPLFLVGALAVQLTEELSFGVAALGTAAGLGQASRAVFALVLGRYVDRLGASFSLKISAAIALTASLGIVFLARTWLSFVLWLMFAATSQAISQPAANRYMVNRIRPERLGTAFGFKQAAPPAATMLAGLSVPLIAVTFGWRWAYGFGALLAVAVLLAVGRRPPPLERGRRAPAANGPLQDRPTIVIFAAGFGLSLVANSVIVTFFVDAAVLAGSSAELAGILLALASLAALTTRIVTGIACDRIELDPLRLCAILLGVGSLGHLLLALGSPLLMGIGVVIALGGTWGFPGLFWFALMRAYPDSPGRITGAVAPGVLGGVLGPMAFGLIVERSGYAIAWSAGGAVAVLASLTMLMGSRRLRRAAERQGTVA